MYFKSIDKLIAQKPVATYYAQDAVGKGKEQQGNDRIILSYNVNRNNDLLKKLGPEAVLLLTNESSPTKLPPAYIYLPFD